MKTDHLPPVPWSSQVVHGIDDSPCAEVTAADGSAVALVWTNGDEATSAENIGKLMASAPDLALQIEELEAQLKLKDEALFYAQAEVNRLISQLDNLQSPPCPRL